MLTLNELGRVSNSPSKKFGNSAEKIQSKKDKWIKVSSLMPIRVNPVTKSKLWERFSICLIRMLPGLIYKKACKLYEAKMFCFHVLLFCYVVSESNLQSKHHYHLDLETLLDTFSIWTWNDKRDMTLILRTSHACRLALDYEARWW